jgi:hypothetical protein
MTNIRKLPKPTGQLLRLLELKRDEEGEIDGILDEIGINQEDAISKYKARNDFLYAFLEYCGESVILLQKKDEDNDVEDDMEAVENRYWFIKENFISFAENAYARIKADGGIRING